MPPPRTAAPLDPIQVQQATEDLITQRDHLNGEAQGAGQKYGAGASTANPQTAKVKPLTEPARGNSLDPTGGGTQTAGTQTK